MAAQDSRVTLTLELDPRTDPIEGCVRGLGHELEFSGWLGLAEALERMLEEKPAAPGPYA